MAPQRAERELLRMLETLRHEDFYSTGMLAQPSLGVYVGWCERKGSFADGMPISNERGDIRLVFSGEEFCENGTKRRLKERGHRFEEEGCPYLVHLYEDVPDFPAQLNGVFHGLVADNTRGVATLFNDRYGMHRLYYYESRHAFYFAAEAKAILALHPELRTADPRSLGELIACGCVLQDRTLFRDIRCLPGGSAWTFRNGSLRERTAYFEPREWENQAPLEPDAYYRELREVFTRKLPPYFDASERVGIALTGGLDTRALLAWRHPPPGSLPCYTFGGAIRDSQDVVLARKVAAICAQTHEVFRPDSGFLSRFPHYAERSVFLSDGCVDVSRAPDLYLSEKARTIAPIKIVGTYGSELLGQAPTFKPREPLSGLFHADVLPHIRQVEATYLEARQDHPVTFAAFRQSPWWHSGVLKLEQTQLTVRSPYLDNELVQTIFRGRSMAHLSDDIRLRLIKDGSPALTRIRSDRGAGGPAGGLRAYASRHLLEFTFKAEYAYDYGMPDWLARVDWALSRFHFERLFLGRHKAFHFRIWYRDVLSAYVRQMLLDPRTLARPYINRRTLETVVQKHLRGDANYTREIHKLLTLELVHRLFLDSPLETGASDRCRH